MQSTVITPELPLRTLLALPEFQEIRDRLLIPDFFDPRLHGDVPLSALSHTWNLSTLCEGLNRVLDLRRAGAPVCISYGPEPWQYLFHFPGKPSGKSAVLCPGGAYSLVWSPSEGYPIAARLNAMGIHAFVVNYRTGGRAQAPGPMEDLAAAVRFLQNHAAEIDADLTDYAVFGFSAGGHLAGSFGTESLGWKAASLPRPGAMVLAYPVVTMGPDSEPRTRAALLGCRENDPAWVRRYSIEAQLTAAYPPTFLWQCEHDAVVPGRNALLLDRALTAHGIPHRCEIFPGADHGTGLADGTAAAGWLDRAVAFLRAQTVK